MTSQKSQFAICESKGAVYCASPAHLKVGISKEALSGAKPLNGLRHKPEGDTTGWYIWSGVTLSTVPDFFEPLHVEHLGELCPRVLPYLGLPPGWRFLIAEDYEDVWFDEALLQPGS